MKLHIPKEREQIKMTFVSHSILENFDVCDKS